jgi:SsrA-binding protein
MYFSGNHAKVEVGLARGKRQYDKRVALAEADAKREMERALRR